MPRRSVAISDFVENMLQKARGLLISDKAIDIDNTQAINVFLFLGTWRYITGKANLDEAELGLVNAIIRTPSDEGLLDELGTRMLKQIDATVKPRGVGR